MKELTAQLELKPNQWQLSCLPNILDIDALVSIFAPWIKEKHNFKERDKDSIEEHQPLKPISTSPGVNNETDTGFAVDTDQNEISLEESTEDTAFDLLGYAKNQGTPELAVFMLDDYLIDLNSAIDKLLIALEKNESESALVEMDKIIIIAKILQAGDLLIAAQEIESAVTDNQLDEAKLKYEALNYQLTCVTSFAQAI